MNLLSKISESSLKNSFPEFNVGDTIKVDVEIKEGERKRIQVFEGTVLARKVRRSKLYYLRDRVGKAAKVKEQLKK